MLKDQLVLLDLEDFKDLKVSLELLDQLEPQETVV